MEAFESTPLWVATLASRDDALEPARGRLRQAYMQFRQRVASLVERISSELPELTVHDITHLDALWRTAGEIAGPKYPINPAEGFVLGGAILLHDAAHSISAYPGGLDEIRATEQWRDVIAQRFGGVAPPLDSVRGRGALFAVLRQLHAQQGGRLLSLKWTVPGSDTPMYLFDDVELRTFYGTLMGLVATSHHWSTHRVTQEFSERFVTPPGFLSPAEWSVDALKVALLLRTADAAHISDQRAPLFRFALQQPSGVSLDHWRFQAKLGQLLRTPDGELRIASATPFSADERNAWWLAYDTACMVDRELRTAHTVLRDEERDPFAATAVLGIETAEAFARQVQTEGWTPIDVRPRIDDVPHVVETLGGSKLYGDDHSVPLRELLQNASDAVRALRAMAGLDEAEGEIVVSVESSDSGGYWLRVTDTGIGMGRHVMTNVLLDFGHSLWSSDRLREEWPGLASRNFAAAGQFGIGFFSIFMLGEQVVVSSRRHSRRDGEESDQWTLAFDHGLKGRPWLRKSDASELLPRAGTRVSVRVSQANCQKIMQRWHDIQRQGRLDPVAQIVMNRIPMLPQQRKALLAQAEKMRGKAWEITAANIDSDEALAHWAGLIAWLCPASEVSIEVRCGSRSKRAVEAGDWRSVSEETLLARLQDPNPAPLVTVNDRNGDTVARLGIGRGLTPVPATLVHGGIRCGQVGYLTGVSIAKAPTDVHRQKAIVGFDDSLWIDWLEAILPRSPEIPLPALRVLHAVCPSADLPIALVGGNLCTLTQCAELARGMSQLMVFFDDLGAKAWDPPALMFGGGFTQWLSGSWVLPDLSPHRVEEIPKTQRGVDYRGRVEETLRAAWGSFDVNEQVDGVIGLAAGGAPVMREAFLYTRRVVS